MHSAERKCLYMGYYSENLKRVREIYANKSALAEKAALDRKYALYKTLPELSEIDSSLSELGHMAVMATIGGGENASEKIKAFKEQSLSLQEARRELLRTNGYPEGYTEPMYECERCRDTGYAEGKMCTCMKRALVLLGYESSGLGKLMEEQSFDSFSLDFYRDSRESYENMKHHYEYIKNFAENFSADTFENIALFGKTGLGKTHLSTSAARTVIDKGFDVLYVTAMSMINDFRRDRFGGGYSENELDGLDRYFTCDLLIIDDLGSEVSNQFTVSVIYDVINTRLSKRKSTMISTNLTSNELREKYWDRITSRILGEYSLLAFKGKDVRIQKLSKNN